MAKTLENATMMDGLAKIFADKSMLFRSLWFKAEIHQALLTQFSSLADFFLEKSLLKRLLDERRTIT